MAAVDLARVGKIHVALVAGGGVFAYATRWMEPASLVLGGAVMGGNLWLLRVIAGALGAAAADPGRQGRLGLALFAMLAKFGLFLGLIAVLFWRLPIEAASFAVGVTMLPVACVAEAAYGATVRAKGVD
jgi:hypothetical protein